MILRLDKKKIRDLNKWENPVPAPAYIFEIFVLHFKVVVPHTVLRLISIKYGLILIFGCVVLNKIY